MGSRFTVAGSIIALLFLTDSTPIMGSLCVVKYRAIGGPQALLSFRSIIISKSVPHKVLMLNADGAGFELIRLGPAGD